MKEELPPLVKQEIRKRADADARILIGHLERNNIVDIEFDHNGIIFPADSLENIAELESKLSQASETGRTFKTSMRADGTVYMDLHSFAHDIKPVEELSGKSPTFFKAAQSHRPRVETQAVLTPEQLELIQEATQEFNKQARTFLDRLSMRQLKAVQELSNLCQTSSLAEAVVKIKKDYPGVMMESGSKLAKLVERLEELEQAKPPAPGNMS